MRADFQKPGSQAFTLIELLLSLTIILLLISLLLPALNRGHDRVKSLRCKSNLHQTGLGMILFATGHDDKFPMQVSTNSGGSAEFVQAGNAVQGDFYFSYKHFQPLAAELNNPSILVCPADARLPATNFASLRNTNLSYFVAADPLYGRPDSVLSGDRNLVPVSNSLARVGIYRPLKWTGEMHQFRGNVLFADGHVELLRDFLSLSNSPSAPATSLVMPSVNVPTAAAPATGPTGGGGAVAGGGASGQSSSGGHLSTSSGSTNQGFSVTNGVLTNLTITSGPRDTPRSAYAVGPPSGDPPLPDFPWARSPSSTTNPPRATPKAAAIDAAGEPQVESANPNLVEKGKELARSGARFAYGIPWWLIVLLLVLMLWLLQRARQRRPAARQRKAPQRPGFVVPGHH